MKFMVVWKTVPGKYKTALDQFLKSGGPAPEGGKTLVIECGGFSIGSGFGIFAPRIADQRTNRFEFSKHFRRAVLRAVCAG